MMQWEGGPAVLGIYMHKDNRMMQWRGVLQENDAVGRGPAVLGVYMHKGNRMMQWGSVLQYFL